MQHLPEVCVSICGAVWLALLPLVVRTLQNAPTMEERR